MQRAAPIFLWLFVACADQPSNGVRDDPPSNGVTDDACKALATTPQYDRPSRPFQPRLVGAPERGSAFFIDEAIGVQQSESTWWLDGDSDLSLSVQFLSSATFAPASPPKFVLIVDGVQKPFLDATGTEVLALDVEAAPSSRTSLRMTVPASEIAVGAHTVVMVLLSMSSGLLDDFVITLFHGGTLFQDRKAVSDISYRDRVYAGQFALADGRHLYQSTPFVWPRKGLVDLQLLLQAPDGIGCRNQANPVTAMLFLDGMQVRTGVGPYAMALVDSEHAARLTTSFTVPDDEGPHALSVLQVTGDGRYTEAPLGTPAPWSHTFVNQIGFVHW